MWLKKLAGCCFIFILLFNIDICKGQSSVEVRIDSITRSAVIDSIGKLLVEKYIFLDVAERIEEHLNKKLKNGDYDKLDNPTDFAKVLREDLFTISKDKHFHIEFNPEQAEVIKAKESQSEEEVEKANKILFEKDRRINFGFKKLEQLRGNIGYLDLRYFCNAEYAGETAVSAMNFLANSDAVIIDLRDTPGGWPNMVQLLCSYFVKGTKEGRTHLNTFERRFDNSIEQFWTMSFVPGKRMYDMDLYILTSEYTGSGAEGFTYHLKNLERVTIIGETTIGSAHPIDKIVIQDKFIMHLPTGRPVNPISGTNWEGTGIEPHIAVPAEQALDKAYLMALEKLLKNVEEERKFQLNWAIDGLRAKLNPVEMDHEIMKKYAGDYGERKVHFENGELYYQRTGPKYKLIYLKENLFAVEGLEYFRIQFVLDENDNVTKLIGLYDDGMEDPSKRIK